MNIERATRAEVPSIVELHKICLPASILTALGDEALYRYYDTVVGSLREHVFVALDEEHAVVAVCVLSMAPGSLLRRFAVGAPVSMLRDLAKGSLLTAELRHRVGARAWEASTGVARGALRLVTRASSRDASDTSAGLPEVTQIFTDPTLRGQGVGTSLLRTVEDTLQGMGRQGYCIHTLRDDNDAGIRFYRREGFTVTGTTTSFGDHYLVMTKGLT